ncbi:hypothetical protein D9619_010245 [Psilocybe cf. subviscida]|uniref:Uncharacterized protein n=1 Tax=Psilocybe cf. subviscida TaxID=2480587 RepID=A0A8H5ERR1_9AGAR|nr:hypothetical protein D9619_010245 [Psilocybe cf. subviscida]
MSTYAQDPLKKARLLSLVVAWCFAVIAACVGLNALVKSNQDKAKLKKLAPAPAVVFIDTNDIYHVGISATVASLVLAILVSVYAVGSVFSPTKGLFARTLRVQAGLLLAACAWLFATMIPYMIFYLHRQAKVTAFIGTTQLPASVIKAVEAQSGSTGVYKQISYLRLVAIFPWLSLFFSLIAVVLLFKSASASSAATATAHSHGTSSPSTSMKEDASHNEKATV